MSKWDKRFLALANLVSTWSKDPSTGVGAVIVDPRNRVVSLGFNGFPHGVDDTYSTREQKLMRTIHAEDNAILFAGRDLTGCTLYVTHHPCARCAAKIIQSGIARVLYSRALGVRWSDEIAEASRLFVEAGREAHYADDTSTQSDIFPPPYRQAALVAECRWPDGTFS